MIFDFSTNTIRRRSTTRKMIFVFCVLLVYFIKLTRQLHHISVWNLSAGKNNNVPTRNEMLKSSNQDHVDNNNSKLELYKKAVVIVTQGRSGSSLLGNVIRLDQDVFYVFEPLYYLRLNHQELHFVDGTQRRKRNFLAEGFETLINILTCNISGLPIEFFQSWANDTLNQGHQLLSFYNKFKGSSDLQKVKLTPKIFRSMLLDLDRQCRESDTVAIKTIRMPLLRFGELLLLMKRLKIIFLIRDPRAVIASQNLNFFTKFHIDSLPLSEISNIVCSTMFIDFSAFNLLNCYCSSQLKLLMYENFVSDIYNETRMINEFLNLNFSNTVIHGIKKMTTEGNNYKAFSTYRKNSKELVSLWRTNVLYNVTKVIDFICSNAYAMAGYCSVENESLLRNTTVPLYGEQCRSKIKDGRGCTIYP